MRKFHMVILTVLAVSPEFLLGQELIDNGTFDSDVQGWNLETSGSSMIEWRANQGLPPGALAAIGDDQTILTSDCFQFETAGELLLSADIFMETDDDFVICLLNYFLYSQSNDCTGNFSEFANIPGIVDLPIVTEPNRWEKLNFFPLILPPDPVAETGVLSYRPVLIKFGDQGGDDACIFDNVSLTFTPAPQNVTEVPVTSPVGLGIFAGLLALGAGLMLRRGSGS